MEEVFKIVFEYMKKERVSLITFFFVAFITRFLYVLFIPGFNTPPEGDGIDYDLIAINLVNHHEFTKTIGHISSWRPPLQPFFLSLIYTISGHNYVIVRIVQILIGSLSCIIIYFIGKGLFSKNVGILALIFAVFYPGIIYCVERYQPENLVIFLLTLSVLYFIKVFENNRIYDKIITGILIGLTTLGKPNLLLFLPFIFLWGFLAFKEKFCGFKTSLVISLSMIAVIAPWSIRNYLLWHEFVPISTNGGFTLFVGNTPWEDGSGFSRRPVTTEEWEKFGCSSPPTSYHLEPTISRFFSSWEGLNEVQTNDRYFSLGMYWIIHNPVAFLQLIPKKLNKFWNPISVSQSSWVKKYLWINVFTYTPILILAIVGFFLSLKEWRKLLISYFLIFSFTFTAIIFFGHTRYRIPIDPLLIVFAAFTISWGYEYLRRYFVRVKLMKEGNL